MGCRAKPALGYSWSMQCRRCLAVLSLLAAVSASLSARECDAAAGQLELSVTDRDTGEPLACRVHLTNINGKPVKVSKTPTWADHFVFSAKLLLKLPKGGFRFVMERGPEYLVRSGHFTIDNFADDAHAVDLKRFVDMARKVGGRAIST